MGRMHMEEYKEQLGMERGLDTHLQCNFFPPLPGYVRKVIVDEFTKHWHDACHPNVLLERINDKLKAYQGEIGGLRTLDKFDEFLLPEDEWLGEPEGEQNVRLQHGEVSIYGKRKYAEPVLARLKRSRVPLDGSLYEGKVREKLHLIMDEKVFDNVSVLYDGNMVYGLKLLKDLKNVVDNNDMKLMSDDLYELFSNCCGSIAHYSKSGWICEYPTVNSLRQFFIKNEFGDNVLAYQPTWAEDRKDLLKKMAKMLKVKLEGKRW